MKYLIYLFLNIYDFSFEKMKVNNLLAFVKLLELFLSGSKIINLWLDGYLWIIYGYVINIAKATPLKSKGNRRCVI